MLSTESEDTLVQNIFHRIQLTEDFTKFMTFALFFLINLKVPNERFTQQHIVVQHFTITWTQVIKSNESMITACSKQIIYGLFSHTCVFVFKLISQVTAYLQIWKYFVSFKQDSPPALLQEV